MRTFSSAERNPRERKAAVHHSAVSCAARGANGHERAEGCEGVR